ncbi:MAG: UvrD-helicase domain-containing protein, partial [Bdellovibrionales bacterium]|nr:UvrD-helicase domain-containing protein [Bdellovibrionales bacterium]
MDISSLNSAQQEAVRSTEGAVMVLAGAGSGKTRMLVKRIGHMIDQQIASTYEILALTFSNKAAREMRERIGQEITLELDLGALQVTTFHSFCARLLRTEANFLGLSRNFTIYGSSESKAVVKSLMGRRGVSSKQISPYEILAYIDDLKNRGYYLEREGGVASEIDLSEDFYGYFREYESELARANALDFGGLITGVLRLFQKFPKVLQCYQDRFKYILIDEYQDTNRAQFELMKWLTGDQGNVCVVGDEDQSIYSWRGADIRNILDFEQSFPEAKTIKLEQNYRSSRNIIEAASCVIARNEQRKGKQMWTDNQPGESLQIVESRDERGEAEFIAAETGRLVSSGVSYNDIAVFYRTNSQSRILEDCLRQRRTPYRVVGGIEFYQRKEIKDLLAYL